MLFWKLPVKDATSSSSEKAANFEKSGLFTLNPQILSRAMALPPSQEAEVRGQRRLVTSNHNKRRV